MKVTLTTEEELDRLIERVVRKVIKDELPEIIRQATRKEWLTSEEVMDYLKCSRRHLQHLRDTNRLTFSQNSRTIRYHIKDVHDYLNRGKVRKIDG